MNKVVHFEIPFEDIERAKNFYTEIFGWEFQQAEGMPYWMIRTVEVDKKMMPKEAGAINGGMLQRDEKKDPGSSKPVIVIDVPDIEDYCNRIVRAGGEIILPTQNVGDMGIYARVKDTEGNIIGLWQNIKK